MKRFLTFVKYHWVSILTACVFFVLGTAVFQYGYACGVIDAREYAREQARAEFDTLARNLSRAAAELVACRAERAPSTIADALEGR